MVDNNPPKNEEMSELERWQAEEKVSPGKLWQEMDDDTIDKLIEGIRGSNPPGRTTEKNDPVP